MAVRRWEDVIPSWKGPCYAENALAYHGSVHEAPVAGGLITCVEVVDWDGDGGHDLVVSCWDACYGGGVYLLEQVDRLADGTPLVQRPKRLQGIAGYVTAARDGESFHLLSTSRLRSYLLLFPNKGAKSEPAFTKPITIPIDADWRHEGELPHLARFVDIDKDGRMELIVGTDYWGDYWPANLEWNEKGYRPYDTGGDWLGGPLRGHLYVFRNEGTVLEPKLSRGVPLSAGERVLETYGALAPTFADFRGQGSVDLVCGDFLDSLHYVPRRELGAVDAPSLITDSMGTPIVLDHCIHFPVAVDWDGDGKQDLLVGAEDGHISWLRHAGLGSDRRPVFDPPVRLRTPHARLHGGVLPVPAAHDWNGNGRLDLIVGNSAGEILFYPNLGQADDPAFGSAVMCRAADQVIRVLAGPTGSIQGPSERKFGYTCPTVADWDRDGRPDLLVSDITGRHFFYRNVGEHFPPSFEQPQALAFEGRPLSTVWRVRPAVVDWLGDGELAYVCLDEEGILATYKRLSDTALADKRLLRFVNGSPVSFTEDFGGGRGRIKLCLCDWTGDGRYDVIFGTHSRASVPPGANGAPRHTTEQAGVFLLENVRSNADPLFAMPRPICYRGEPIRLGMHACSPEAVDWRGSGKHDLLVGAEDGSLLWFRRDDLSW